MHLHGAPKNRKEIAVNFHLMHLQIAARKLPKGEISEMEKDSLVHKRRN